MTGNPAVLDAAAPRQGEAELHLHLDAPFPSSLAVGEGTALFVAGWCFHPRTPIRSLELVVDGRAQPVVAHGMPRLDVFRALHPGVDPFATAGMASDPASSEDPGLHSYRSGFWGIARVLPGAAQGGECELALRAGLQDGGQAEVELARIPITESVASPATPEHRRTAGPLVAVCMATYDPPLELLRAQLDSIRAQTHGEWVCVISDDCSKPELFAAIQEAVAGDERFVVSRSPRRLGFYHNFERALAMAPVGADYVAMADQDDLWHPDKLTSLLAAIGGAQLVYSDARIIDERGELLSETYWSRRRNNHSSLLSLLVANAVTGAASLFPRRLLDDALPFPPAQFAHFHDHWIGADRARARRCRLRRPAALRLRAARGGHARARGGQPDDRLRTRLSRLRRDPRERIRMWRMHYFVDVCRLMQFATVLDLRCGERMAPAKRGTWSASWAPIVRCWGWQALAGGARELLGRPETLGAEWMLSYAFAWRRALTATTRERPVRGCGWTPCRRRASRRGPGTEARRRPPRARSRRRSRRSS